MRQVSGKHSTIQRQQVKPAAARASISWILRVPYWVASFQLRGERERRAEQTTFQEDDHPQETHVGRSWEGLSCDDEV